MGIRRTAAALTISGGIALGVVGAAGVAAAQTASPDYPGGTTQQRVDASGADRVEVLGDTQARGAEVSPAAEERGAAALALTGGDVVGLSVLGVGLVGVGTVIVRRTRRSTAA